MGQKKVYLFIAVLLLQEVLLVAGETSAIDELSKNVARAKETSSKPIRVPGARASSPRLRRNRQDVIKEKGIFDSIGSMLQGFLRMVGIGGTTQVSNPSTSGNEEILNANVNQASNGPTYAVVPKPAPVPVLKPGPQTLSIPGGVQIVDNPVLTYGNQDAPTVYLETQSSPVYNFLDNGDPYSNYEIYGNSNPYDSSPYGYSSGNPSYDQPQYGPYLYNDGPGFGSEMGNTYGGAPEFSPGLGNPVAFNEYLGYPVSDPYGTSSSPLSNAYNDAHPIGYPVGNAFSNTAGNQHNEASSLNHPIGIPVSPPPGAVAPAGIPQNDAQGNSFGNGASSLNHPIGIPVNAPAGAVSPAGIPQNLAQGNQPSWGIPVNGPEGFGSGEKVQYPVNGSPIGNGASYGTPVAPPMNNPFENNFPMNEAPLYGPPSGFPMNEAPMYGPPLGFPMNEAPPMYGPPSGFPMNEAPMYGPPSGFPMNEAPPMYGPPSGFPMNEAPPMYGPPSGFPMNEAPPMYGPPSGFPMNEAPSMYGPPSGFPMNEAPPMYGPPSAFPMNAAPGYGPPPGLNGPAYGTAYDAPGYGPPMGFDQPYGPPAYGFEGFAPPMGFDYGPSPYGGYDPYGFGPNFGYRTQGADEIENEAAEDAGLEDSQDAQEISNESSEAQSDDEVQEDINSAESVQEDSQNLSEANYESNDEIQEGTSDSAASLEKATQDLLETSQDSVESEALDDVHEDAHEATLLEQEEDVSSPIDDVMKINSEQDEAVEASLLGDTSEELEL